jgi:UDP-N-acetylmuramate dehydrogenase
LEAEILHRVNGRETWSAEKMKFVYRGSALKENPGETVVLTAKLKLERQSLDVIQEKMNTFLAHRRQTQPPGASMGSMFKNPQGDFAGRLIDAAGLKGTRVGGAEISRLHGNFFVNIGQSTATDVYDLIQQAKQAVAEKFNVELELEIALIGDWSEHLG